MAKFASKPNTVIRAGSLRAAYPNIMRAFDNGRAQEIQGLGKYAAYIMRAGLIIVLVMASDGSFSLMSVDSYDLARLLGTNSESASW